MSRKANIDLDELSDWQDAIMAANRILKNAQKTGIWSETCSVALEDLWELQQKIDRAILNTVMEEYK